MTLFTRSFYKLTLVRKKHLLRSVIYDLTEMWPNDLQSQEKKMLMDMWVRRTKKICDYVFKFTIFGLLVYNTFPLFLYFARLSFDKSAVYIFPFHVYYPFEMDSLWKYLLTFTTQIVSTVMIFACNSQACDMFLFTLTLDVSMLFRLLQHDLANIKVVRQTAGAEESMENLTKIIKRHQKLLQLADKLDDIFGAIMFSFLIFSSVIICLFGFIFIATEAKIQKFMYLIATLECLFSVFIIMLPGQILYDTSIEVAAAAYESSWYNGDQRFKKMIFIIIARSQKPCRLRAMGYADMNFETFYTICGTSWSYMAVVNQMYQNRFE